MNLNERVEKWEVEPRKESGRWIRETIALLIDLIADWKRLNALAAYASHDENCTTWNGLELPCTCGLTEIEK